MSDIYPKEFIISQTTESTSVASYLDLLFTKDENKNITTKLYDKCDVFGFHIVSNSFMSSNIPLAPANGVYASQLIRYPRCCSNYSDLFSRHWALVTTLLSQGYKANRLSNTFKKLYGRHIDLVGQHKKMSVKCSLILPVKMIFLGFVKAEWIKLAQMMGVILETDHAYSIRSTWSLHGLATDVPSIACVINSQSIFVCNLDFSNFLSESGLR